MNKEQFLSVLEQSLFRLPKADRDDILSDYEAHFTLGAANGKSEEQISAELGNPGELAQTYLENLPEGAKGAEYIPVVTEDIPEENESQANDNGAQYTPPKATIDSGSSTFAGANAQSENVDKSSGIIVVVLLSVFVALPLLGTIVGGWFSLLGVVVSLITAAVAVFGIGVASVIANGLFGAGLILIALALGVLAALFGVGMAAACKGVVWLVKWYIEQCKKIINGGAF